MSSSKLLEIQKFYPAVIKDLPSVGMVVEYYVYDPVAEEMVRRRIKLSRLMSRYKTKHQRLLAAQNIADELNAKLRGDGHRFIRRKMRGFTPGCQTCRVNS